MKWVQIQALFTGKSVLFVTTKNISYLRNVQEKNILTACSKQTKCVGSDDENYLLRVMKAYWGSLRFLGKSTQAVFVGFAPQLMLPLFWLYKLRGRPLVIDFFISLYDTFVCERKTFTVGSLPAKLLHWLDGATLRGADAFVVDTRADLEFFVREFGACSDQGCVLYLCADTTVYHPMEVMRPEGLEHKYVVLYFGSVLPLQGVDVVLQAMRLLKQEANIYFIFIGPLGKQSTDINKTDMNAEFHKWLSQEDLAKKIAVADLCLAGHFSGEIDKARRTIPGKAYIYRAMNKPMILGDGTANHELFHADAKTHFIPMGNAPALAKMIRALAAVEDRHE